MLQIQMNIADDCMRRERLGVAEGANNEGYESLRQKDSYMTQLWRVSGLADHQRGKPQGQTFRYRTEISLAIRGISVYFL